MSNGSAAATETDAALYGSIDVGTNSVKLTVADMNDPSAPPVFDQSVTTRLGEGMQAQGNRLREAPMRRTLDTIADYVEMARAHRVMDVAAVGTAALRDAVNRDEFLDRVQERCGLRIAVISGEEEARLSFLAVRFDPHWRAKPRLVVIDIGGGSTELIQGDPEGTGVAGRTSINLGAVRVTENFLRSDPPTVAQLAAANEAVAEEFAKVPLISHKGDVHIIGVGGTLTNLGGIQLGGPAAGESLHGYVLGADRLENTIERLASCTTEERKTIPGLDPARADIILGGAIMLSQALAYLGSATVDVSTRGLRWGVLYDRFLAKA